MADLTYDPNTPTPRKPRPIASSPFWMSTDANAAPGLRAPQAEPPPGLGFSLPTPMGWLTPEMMAAYANAAAPSREDIASTLGAPVDGMAWAARKLGAKGIPSVYGQPDFTQRATNGAQLVPKPSADVPGSSEHILQLLNRYIPRGGLF